MELIYQHYIHELETGETISNDDLRKFALGCDIKSFKDFAWDFMFKIIEHNKLEILQGIINEPIFKTKSQELIVTCYDLAFNVLNFDMILLIHEYFKEESFLESDIRKLAGNFGINWNEGSDAYNLVIWYIKEKKRNYNYIIEIFLKSAHGSIWKFLNEKLNIKDYKLDKKVINTMLKTSIKNGNFELFKQLIEYGADIRQLYDHDIANLIKTGQTDFVLYLIKCYNK